MSAKVLVLKNAEGKTLGYYVSETEGDSTDLQKATRVAGPTEELVAMLNKDPKVVNNSQHYVAMDPAEHEAGNVKPTKAKNKAQATKLVEKGAALWALATIMIRHEVSADEANSHTYDTQRVALMMQQGINGSRATQLLEMDISQLID